MMTAIILILASGSVVLAALHVVRSLGAYTETQKDFAKALLQTHETNLLLHQHQLRMLDELRGTRLHRPSPEAHEGEPEHEVKGAA